MEKDKKRIIAGGVILSGTAALAYYLMKRGSCTPGDTKCIGNDLYVCNAQRQWELSEKDSPQCIVQENTGRIQGKILDAETNAPILTAMIYVDGAFHCYAGPSGTYRTDYIPYGSHTVTAKADNYQTVDVTVTLSESLMINVDILLLRLPTVPTDWTEGTVVTKIIVTPPTVYLGETANIKVYIQGPYPAEYPLNIYGTILVDGESVRRDFTIDFRNPTLLFPYTPSKTGSYIVRAQDKSAEFTVLPGGTGTYYSPFGGNRIPVCTRWKLAAPITFNFQTYDTLPEEFEVPLGGFSSSPVFGLFRVPKFIGMPQSKDVDAFIDAIMSGQPSEWYPDQVQIGNWTINQISSDRIWGGSFTISLECLAPCPTSWETKEELAQAIARFGTLKQLIARLPGVTYSGNEARGNVPEVTGIAENVKNIIFGYQQKYGNVEPYDYIVCPYCNRQIRDYEESYITLARKLLEHIELDHPDHPLTEEAWFSQ